MRLSKPRIRPLEADEWSDAAKVSMKPFVEAGADHNIFKTLTNHPDLMRRWLVFANHVLFKQSRERELVILRIGYLCQAGYEWGQHVMVARRAGTDDEIRSHPADRIPVPGRVRMGPARHGCAAGGHDGRRDPPKTGPSTPGLSARDRLLLQATDELHADAFITDETWNALTAHLDQLQLMDLVFTVGQYNLVSMALNSFGVQLDEGLPGWDI